MPPRADESRPKPILREATPEESAPYRSDQYETACFVFEEDGQVRGRVCLSRALGECFGHDLEYAGYRVSAPARLIRRAHKQAREWGMEFINVHVDFSTPARSVEFWQANGFEVVIVVLRRKV